MSDETKVTRDSNAPTLFASTVDGIDYIIIDGVRFYPGQMVRIERSNGQWVFVEWLTPPATDEDDTD